MNKKYIIFDMDGTLVDSMRFWRGLAAEFLKKKGIEMPADLLERIKPMTMSESSALFVEEFNMSETPEEVAAEMRAMMAEHYRRDVPIKPGAEEYVRKLRAQGAKMCVASATPNVLMNACMTRLGIIDCFDFIISCEEVGIGKHQPDVYFESARRLGAEPSEIAVYEDAIYASRTAKAAGFYLVGVFDETSADRWDQLKALADESFECWDDAVKTL